jgi:hypothetical protein
MDKQPFIFVLMPINEDFEDVFELGVKAASEVIGAKAERLNDQIFTENMLTRIYEQIASADLIVADMTGKNPNVFYEVGYSHALEKNVILLTKNPDEIPFDLKHYPHIVYYSIGQLKKELVQKLAILLEDKLPKPSKVLSEAVELADSQEEISDDGKFKKAWQEYQAGYYADETNGPFKLLITISETGDRARDILRLRRIHGLLISNPGEDQFAFYLPGEGNGTIINMYNATTNITEELLARLRDIVGSENVAIHEL